MADAGKAIRLARILGSDGRATVLAFDHGLQLGPVEGTEDPGHVLETAVEAGIDAVLVTPGLLRRFAQMFAGRNKPGILVRMDWSNMWRPVDELGFPEGGTEPIAAAETALALGADAVLGYQFLGLADPDAELRNVRSTAAWIEAGHKLGLPVAIEPMISRRHPPDTVFRADLVAMHVRMVTEMGVDLIKTDYTGDAESFRRVIDATWVPVLAAGGAWTDPARTEEDARQIIASGAAGVFFGRRLFQAPDMGEVVRRIASVVHGVPAKSGLHV